MKATHILDASALLCFLRDEKGADTVLKLLQSNKNRVKMHRINLGEVYYGVLKKDGEEKANHLYGMLLQYPVEYIESLGDAFILTASRLKVKYNLGFADSFVATTAVLENAILVTKDNDFRPMEKDKIVSVLWV